MVGYRIVDIRADTARFQMLPEAVTLFAADDKEMSHVVRSELPWTFDAGVLHLVTISLRNRAPGFV